MQSNHLPKLIMLVIVLLFSGQSAFAQLRVVGAISGTVQDPQAAAVPNAQVTLKDVKTQVTKETTTNDHGTFFFPDLVSGVYEVTVTLAGFQRALVQNINVQTSQTTDVKISLEVGQPTETVTVTSESSQLLETSGQIVANTITAATIQQLPLGNRGNVLVLARLSPGISPPIGGGNSGRYNNLPGGAVNVTVDGINDASNGFKSGGTVFFATVPVRLGAVEEVSVETAGLGADSGAESGANIKFTTRRGGSEYHGSFFYEPRTERFNANPWNRNANNLARVYNRTQEYGGNIGGPLIPFGSLKKKAFFFFNYERTYAPTLSARTVTVLTPAAQQGNYSYLVPGTNQIITRNVLALAGAASPANPTTIDPIAANILAINNEVPKFATQIPDSDLNRDTYTWTADNPFYAYFPAARFDVFVTPKQQVTWTWNYRHSWQVGERRLPTPDISRTNPFRLGYFVWAIALQSTLTSNTFNEFRYGVQHSGDSNASAAYGAYFTVNDKPLRIGGNLPFAQGAAPNPISPVVPFIDQQNTTGRHFITTMYDTLTMNRGNHTWTMGFSYRKTDWKDIGQVFQLPTYTLGTPSGDPLPGQVFTAANFPGITNTLLPGDPAALYNTLIGRVAASNFTRVVDPDTLKYDGFHNFTWTSSLMGGAYVQDRWRFSPSLTFNYGLRWEVQGPMHDARKITAVPDLASLYGPSVSLFTPGTLSGNNNPQVKVGAPAYKTDWLTLAPNFGFAWNPNIEKGFLGKVFGGSKTVLRGAYSLVVYDEGTQFYAQNLGTNAGKTIAATALIPGQTGQTNLPRFYTLSNIVANPLNINNFAFPSGTEYKSVINQADQTFVRTISGFDPTLRAPYTVNWNLGFQREIWQNAVIEARYVGTQTHLAWRTSNLNEVNIFENGFLEEFKKAQNNLAINVAAGSNSFANQGRPGQVALPIFDAAFGPRGALAAIASASGYTNPAFITNLQNGEAGALANTLATNQNYVCRMFGSNFSPCARVLPTANAPGVYPINFFLLNPFVAGRMNFVDDTGWHSYNGLQVQFRQRLTHGLNWNANWTWSHSMTNLPADSANQGIDFLTLRNTDLDKRPSQFDIRHVVQMYGTYDLPVGRGRMFNVDNKILNGVIGGWTVGSIFVFATGQPLQLTGGFQTVNTSNSTAAQGVVLAPGVTLEQLQRLFDAPLTRIPTRPGNTTNDTQRLAVDPSLLGPDFRASSAFLLPNRTPGSFGQQLFIRDKNTVQFDLSITKSFRIVESTKLELFASFNNVLNHPRWAYSNDANGNANTTGNPVTALNVFSQLFGVINAPVGNRSINLRVTLSF